ncbi:CidA/LrgA family protein [Anaeromicropila populeti]|uniref:Holin-like protein n=1 Tax=Anaeromicropila populeti TaxID=37658 RepID=A0A1I6JWD2_9FIRM|nr:CidA/LrgA family protein [Anaeromicropila populeti]SFR83208.1 holin-like protein [Anaeromicropila populeti]
MKLLKQLFILFLLCFCSEAIAGILPIPFPASIISLLLLLLLLLTRLLKKEHIQEVSEFLLGTMAFFFIPAGVAIIKNYDAMKHSLLPILIIIFISTILTFASTAYTVTLCIKFIEKRKGK